MTTFFSMGGYGFFVWGSYGMLAVAITLEIWQLRRRRAAALAQLANALQEDQE